MPRTKRQDLKLKHDQTLTHITTAIGYMTEMYELFRDVHPDYAQGYENICMALAQVHEFVERMKEFI